MLQKREDYSVSDKLKIIDHIKNGTTKASISQEYGIRGGTIRGWKKNIDFELLWTPLKAKWNTKEK